MWKNPKLQRWLPWRTLLPHSRRVMLHPATDYSYPLLAQAAADMIAAGGNAAVGSHGQAHGIGPHWEVWMAASALGNHGALEMGMLGGARFLGVDADIGVLAPGRLADLIVLNSNPLEDIRNTADIRYVMKGAYSTTPQRSTSCGRGRSRSAPTRGSTPRPSAPTCVPPTISTRRRRRHRAPRAPEP